MHLLKVGNKYVTADGDLSDSQRDAARFDTIDAAQAQASNWRVRPVKLRSKADGHLGGVEDTAIDTADNGGL